MIDTSKLAIIVAMAASVLASPTFAQSFAPNRAGRVITAAPGSALAVDRNNPALTGGGSLGYNQRVEQGF